MPKHTSILSLRNNEDLFNSPMKFEQHERIGEHGSASKGQFIGDF